MPLLTDTDRACMDEIIQCKYDDWGETVVFIKDIVYAQETELGPDIDEPEQSFDTLFIQGKVNAWAQYNRNNALQVSKEFLQPGITDKIEWIVFIRKKTLEEVGEVIEKDWQITVRGQRYYIVGVQEYINDILVICSNEDF